MTMKTLLSLFISLTFLISGISLAATKSQHRVSKRKAPSSLKKRGRSKAITTPKAKTATDEVVNINADDPHTIATLKGIGIHKAEQIVRYREAHGKFKSIEDLTNVKGISKKTVERNHLRLKLR